MRKFIRIVAALLLLPSGAAYAQPLGSGGSGVVSCASSFVDGDFDLDDAHGGTATIWSFIWATSAAVCWSQTQPRRQRRRSGRADFRHPAFRPASPQE
jgi:hypothetical protein